MVEYRRLAESGLKMAVGSRADWRLPQVRFERPKVGSHWLGPLVMIASVGLSWWAFAGAIGKEESAAFGLYIGAVAILLMAWSFVLALRIRTLERFFGGLDSMYRTHRWSGALAVVSMFLHVQIEPQLADGVLGASKSAAETALDLAGGAEVMFYALVAVSLLRWFPYRIWRWTHKALGVPFILSCWHFFTSEKPYGNGSGWGWWFGTVMLVGVGAYLARVVGRDVLVPGTPYRITGAESRGSALELTMTAAGQGINFRAGQFAVVKVQAPGLREPHIFTIASSPGDGQLRFFIRDLGDWTRRLFEADLVGVPVIVEGPYGEFDPFGHPTGQTVWIAGGVGVTPFLSAIQDLPIGREDERPTLFFCVHDANDLMGIETLREASAQGRIDLAICSSSDGTRFSEAILAERFGKDGLRGAHVAVCGPASLVSAASVAVRSLGATYVERESFDIRQGFGPDLSREVDRFWQRTRRSSVPDAPNRATGGGSRDV